MDDLIIRQFQPQDKENLLKLFMEFGQYLQKLDRPYLDLLVIPNNYSQKYFDKMIADVKNKNGVILVLGNETEIFGFIAGVIISIGNDPEEFDCKPHKMGRVIELFISESQRSKGYGSMLMREIEQYFAENDCAKVNIEVFGPNKSAYNFYKSHGYEERNIDLAKPLKLPVA